MPLGGLAPCPLPLGGTPLDGLTSQQHARLCADLKAAVATAPFAIITFNTSDPVPTAYLGQHGVGVLAAPTITVLGVGDARVAWEASYTDEYDVAQGTNIKHAEALVHSLGIFPASNAYVEIETPRQVRVRVEDRPGSVPTHRTVSLVVW